MDPKRRKAMVKSLLMEAVETLKLIDLKQEPTAIAMHTDDVSGVLMDLIQTGVLRLVIEGKELNARVEGMELGGH
jgi:hypothetical protein